MMLLGIVLVQCSPKHHYPAFTLDLPQVLDQGGPRLTHPDVVLWIAPDDPNKGMIVHLLETISSTQYWRDATHEYGAFSIGKVTAIDLPAFAQPTAPSGKDMEAIVARLAHDRAFADAGAPNGDAGTDAGPATLHPETIYIIVLPSTSMRLDSSCTADSGYHSDTRASTGDQVPYIVLLDACITATLPLEQVLSHELVETMTDPFVNAAPGLFGVDDPHLAFFLAGQSELADMCTHLAAEEETPDFLDDGKTPARFASIWSNGSALRWQGACAPRLEPFAYAMPVLTETVPIVPGGRLTRGVTVGLNDHVTIEVQIATDQPTEGMPIFAFDVASGIYGDPPELAFSFEEDTVVNGDVAHLTITRVGNPTELAGSVFLVQAGYTSQGMASYGFVAAPDVAGTTQGKAREGLRLHPRVRPNIRKQLSALRGGRVSPVP
jgi:hypothetical protein